MNKIQLTKNLWLHEYIPKEMYKAYNNAGKLHRLPWKLDKELILSDQALRDHFGILIINSWIDGGDRNWSGIRTIDSKYYSTDSSHSGGNASDKIFKNVTATEVQKFIKNNWKSLGITELELGCSWVHSGTRFVPGQKELLTFNV